MSLAGRARQLVDVEHRGLVWLLSLNHGFNEFFSIILPPLFPFIVPSLGIGYSRASLLVVAFFITYSVFQVPAGRIVDVYSPHRMLAGGQALLSVGIGLVAVAPSLPLMLVGMVVAGVGGSTYHPTGMSVISDVEPESTHGRSMGIHGMIGTLGPVASPVAMTAVAVTYGWRSALLAGSALGLLFSVALYVLYPVVRPEEAAVSSTGGFVDSVRSELYDDLGGSLRRGLASLQSPATLGLITLFAVVGAEVRAVQSFTPVFASQLVGDNPAFGNAMLAVTMVAAGLASTGAGALVDRVDRRAFAGGCFGLTAVMVWVLVSVPVPRLVLPAAFALLGIVLYSIYPATNAIAASISTPDQSGSLFAVTQTAAALGAAAGTYLLGTVADATTLQVGFLTVSAIALAGVAVVALANGLTAGSSGTPAES